eukprot:TRINITY_DN3348_c1_g1_i2.p1 TRINITY_DN3348_c1_g1~~TRINITY_DN3348_c1_g1_i2.p1  ORF type:complete len:701 (-),score=230.30 TRINITY_DN3348_c1_g1_i2:135-2237(-)
MPRGAAEGGDDLAAAVGRASAEISGLLESGAEWLLDPQSKESKSTAEGARALVKYFFDACQARGPETLRKTAGGLQSLVVKGFDCEQIWEELEVQNVPLRRHLRRHVGKLVAAPKGTVDLSLAEPSPRATSSTARRAKEGPDEEDDSGEEALEEGKDDDDNDEQAAPKKGTAAGKAKTGKKKSKAKGAADDRGKMEAKASGDAGQDFFSSEAMEKFTELADTGKMRIDEDAGDSDFDLLEAGDDDGDDEAANMMFSDFFGPADGPGDLDKEMAGMQLEGEEEEPADDDELDEEDLSDEEKELEAKIKALQAEGPGEDEEEEDKEDDGEVTGQEDDDEGTAKKPSKEKKSLYEMDKRLMALEAEVNKLEEEQLQERTWEMKGEVSARQRPLNSLLEVSLDQPMTHFAARRAEETDGNEAEGVEDALEDAPGANDLTKKSGLDIEAIVRQRIWDEAFDDVIRKAELPPSQRPQGADEDSLETLNFEKSRIGLGDVYAKQYEAELLGHKTEAEKEEDKEKAEAKQLFAKLMYKLDLLSNAHFTPRPPLLSVIGNQASKVPSLKMEETIPLMVSDATLQAPEEKKAARKHIKDHSELSHDEKAAVRRSKKVKRRKELGRKVEEGQMSLAGKRERDKKLQELNMAAKQEKASRGQVKERHKRLKASELLSQAAENAKSDVSRKEEIRKERNARPDGTPSAKRLKL